MTRLYEGMFLLENQAVREDWKAAKALSTDIIEKHGGKITTARRWDERKLAYPINKRLRATYLLTFFEIEGGDLTLVRRDLELDERVLRYLITSSDAVPDEERELSEAELSDDFVAPVPPAEDAVDPELEAEGESADGEKAKGGEAKKEEAKADEAKAEEPKAEEPKAEEPKAEETAAPAADEAAASDAPAATEAPATTDTASAATDSGAESSTEA